MRRFDWRVRSGPAVFVALVAIGLAAAVAQRSRTRRILDGRPLTVTSTVCSDTPGSPQAVDLTIVSPPVPWAHRETSTISSPRTRSPASSSARGG